MRDLLARTEGPVVRALLLDRPYASAWDYAETELERAGQRLDALRAAAGRPHGSDTAPAAVLSALVDDLDSKHPGLKNRLVTEEGKLHRFVNVYVNDEDVRFTGALDTQVKDGDSVTILPAVAGG